jgi:integrase
MPNELRLDEREGIWYAVGTFNRKRVRKSLGTRDEERAVEQLALLEARLWKRHNFGEKAVRTFEEAALHYMQQGGERRYLKPLIKRLKGVILSDITPGEIRAIATELYPSASGATKNRQVVTPAKAVINHAHDLGWCAPIRVKPFEESKPTPKKPVDRAWLDAFLAQADSMGLPHLAGIVLFMHDTAARISEAMRVRGEHVNFAARKCLLERTKTDENVLCSLTSELMLRMAALDAGEDDRVFSYTNRVAVNQRIAAVCKAAGIEYRSTHALGRHTFATNAIADGTDVKTAMDAGRWKSVTIFMGRYVHSDDAAAKVASAIDEKRGLVGTDSTQAKSRKRYRFGK